MNRLASFVLLVLAIAACGGDDETTTVPAEILPSSTYANRCEAPRSGKDANGDTFPDKDGNLLDEQLFLRRKVAIRGSARHARLIGYLGGGRCASLRDQVGGRSQQLAPCAQPLARTLA